MAKATTEFSSCVTCVTKFKGPTNHRGSHIRAVRPGCKPLLIGRDYSVDATENHLRAAKWLIGPHVAGGEVCNGEYHWVALPEAVVESLVNTACAIG